MLVDERAKFDARLGLIARELPRVSEQILERRPKQAGITGRRQGILDRPRHGAMLVGSRQSFRNSARQRRHVNPHAVHLRPSHARQRQQIIDQLSHPLGGFPDVLQVLSTLIIELLRAVFDQRLAETVDAAQWRAQIMSHGITEGLELVIRVLRCDLGLPQRYVGTQAHFERSQALGKKAGRLDDECRPLGSRREQLNQRFMVHHRHLDDTDAVTGGLASQFVRLRKRRLAGPRQIVAEHRRIALCHDVADARFSGSAHDAHFFNVTVVP